MKHCFAVMVLINVLFHVSFSQNKKWKTPRYMAKIKDKSDNHFLSGALYDVTDSTVTLTCSICKKEMVHKFLVTYHCNKIDVLLIRRKYLFFCNKEKISVARNRQIFFSNKELIKKYCYIDNIPKGL